MSSSLADLHPCFRPVAEAILADARVRIAPSVIRPAVTFRTVAEQHSALTAGLSQVSLGWHQFGLAMDVAIITPEGVYVEDGTDPRYRAFGEAARAHGCVWGGDWTKPDWDHTEHHPGFSLTQYLNWLDSHRIDRT